MHRNRSVSNHQFAMVPRADVPRASFSMNGSHKTTFDAGYLIPVYVQEILPGDSFKLRMTAFCRLATPIFPVMDNMYLESFFFFVPYRLVWDNFVKFMGEQANPGDSTSYVMPKVTSPGGGYAVGNLYDYFGLPTVGQLASGAATVTHQNLPARAYNLIWNQWFRDENMQNSVVVDKDDGPDDPTDYVIRRRNKRPDYFTTCLPWPQKGGTAVSLPLGTSAAVKTGVPGSSMTGVQNAVTWSRGDGSAPLGSRSLLFNAGGLNESTTTGLVATGTSVYPNNLYADLSTATAATINQLRQAFQVQRLLERDARGGTRYVEKIEAHFGVRSPDARLQRPEYLGGGSTPVVLNPVAQTSATGINGSTTPIGNLAAIGTALAHQHGFTQSFVEHGVVIGLVNVRADLNYQQGIHKMWLRDTIYDHYWPAFAMLGEQAVLRKEIYVRGDAGDDQVFGYQERWAEYRYGQSKITGLFRSTAAGTLDAWHLAQNFTSAPTLNTTFISETPPVGRVLAVGAAANGAQFIFDSFFEVQAARPMPLYSVPGMIDHF